MRLSTGKKAPAISFLPRDYNRVAGVARNAALAGLLLWLMIAVIPSLSANESYHFRIPLNSGTASAANQECHAKTSTDLVFIIDQSGSMARSITGEGSRKGRGQTYNMQIEGVLRALTDPTIIPRDGTFAVSVITFNREASVEIKLTSFDCSSARIIISKLEQLRCDDRADGCGDSTTLASPCPSGNTFFSTAIAAAREEFGKGSGERRVLIFSTDGEPEDLNPAREEADLLRSRLMPDINVILVGLNDNTTEFIDEKERIRHIFFPNLPAKTSVIEAGECNRPCEKDLSKCQGQASEFARLTREILGGSVVNLVVRTAEDTEPGATPSVEPLSLRQAIEIANGRCGSATISFADNVRGKTIRPRAPLPPLLAPGITIDGIAPLCDVQKARSAIVEGSQNPACVPSITIDGAGQLNDGIQISSFNNTVRGLRVIGFKRAGIVINQSASCGTLPSNKIELNAFENNEEAGVLVLDSPSGQGSSDGEDHNLGNTISCNAISGSRVLIDRRGPDSAPLPPAIEQVSEGDLITITGSTDSTLAGASVEVFAVTRLRVDSGTPIMDAVVCRGFGVTGSDGRFTVTLRNASPTCAYAATVTDSNGTTSELGYSCACRSEAVADTSAFRFKARSLLIDAAGPFRSLPFTVRNAGCDSVIRLRSFSFVRPSSIADEDKSNLFFVAVGDSNTPLMRDDQIAINPGDDIRLNLFFRSIIPRPEPCRSLKPTNLPEALPRKANSKLVIGRDGANEPPLEFNVSSNVGKKLLLINPDCNKPLLPAQIKFSRSGDNFFVTFGLFDSYESLSRLTYEFYDRKGNKTDVIDLVKGELSSEDVFSAISQLPEGESFTARQAFIGALDRPEVSRVVVTVSNGSIQSRAEAELGQSSNRADGEASAAMMRLPALKLPPAPHKSFRKPATLRSKGNTSEERRRR